MANLNNNITVLNKHATLIAEMAGTKHMPGTKGSQLLMKNKHMQHAQSFLFWINYHPWIFGAATKSWCPPL